ncbi:hypothetical protein NNO07_22660 [Pseudomonas resinovorans]|uniref:Uncharacterized protein n=1 Tax=Metapseudomonas resinovorans TaxID=53412 RepID=A0ABT4YAP5_METRE|nr:hypothetical protein [Pseudomonas resinovorans]MDA8485879.1 hypothetical protein [Pseudomonas resinovorans]
MDSSPNYMSRNRDRQYGAASKYLEVAAGESKPDPQRAALAGKFEREKYRLERSTLVEFNGTPEERGTQLLLNQLHAVRDAENTATLITRGNELTRMIDLARAYRVITREQYLALMSLERNAIENRKKELRKC